MNDKEHIEGLDHGRKEEDTLNEYVESLLNERRPAAHEEVTDTTAPLFKAARELKIARGVEGPREEFVGQMKWKLVTMLPEEPAHMVGSLLRRLSTPVSFITFLLAGTRIRRLASLTTVMIAAAVLATVLSIRPWESGPSPIVAIAEAYDRLNAVESFKLVTEQRMKTLGGMSTYTPANPPECPECIGEISRHVDCTEIGSFRSCIVVDKETGDEIGKSMWVGGVTTTVWYYAGVDTYYQRSTSQIDVPVPALESMERPHETLRLSDQIHYRVGYDKWRRMYCREDETRFGSCVNPETTYEPWYWKLMGADNEGLKSLLSEFDEVERLPNMDMDGIRVEHYQGTRSGIGEQGDWSKVVDVWIGVEDRLPRKVVREYYTGEESSGGATYWFSEFNEPVDIASFLDKDVDGPDIPSVWHRYFDSYEEACDFVDFPLYQPTQLPGSLWPIKIAYTYRELDPTGNTPPGNVYTRFNGYLDAKDCPECDDLHAARNITFWQGPTGSDIPSMPDTDILPDDADHGVDTVQGVQAQWLWGPWLTSPPAESRRSYSPPVWDNGLVLYWEKGGMAYRMESPQLDLTELVKIADSFEMTCPGKD